MRTSKRCCSPARTRSTICSSVNDFASFRTGASPCSMASVISPSYRLARLRAGPGSAEGPQDLVQAFHQRVDVLAPVVERQGGARGGGAAQAPHQRLAAMVAGADGDALAVEHRAHVVRMQLAELERQHGGLL